MVREATETKTGRAGTTASTATEQKTTAGNGQHSTTDRVADRAHRTLDQAAEHAARAEQYLREGVHNAEDRLRETGHEAKARSDALIASIGTYVRENPLTSVGIAFAAGALYSALTRRR